MSEVLQSLGGEVTPSVPSVSETSADESLVTPASVEETNSKTPVEVASEPPSPPAKKTKKKTKQRYVTVNIPKEEFVALKEMAKARKLRPAGLVRVWIQEAVTKEQTPA